MRLIISVGPSQPAYISLAPDDLLCLLSTFFMSLQIMIVSVESRHRIISEFLNNKMRPATLRAALSASHLLYSDVCEAICTPMSIRGSPGLPPVPRWSVVMSVTPDVRARCIHGVITSRWTLSVLTVAPCY